MSKHTQLLATIGCSLGLAALILTTRNRSALPGNAHSRAAAGAGEHGSDVDDGRGSAQPAIAINGSTQCENAQGKRHDGNGVNSDHVGVSGCSPVQEYSSGVAAIDGIEVGARTEALTVVKKSSHKWPSVREREKFRWQFSVPLLRVLLVYSSIVLLLGSENIFKVGGNSGPSILSFVAAIVEAERYGVESIFGTIAILAALCGVVVIAPQDQSPRNSRSAVWRMISHLNYDTAESLFVMTTISLTTAAALFSVMPGGHAAKATICGFAALATVVIGGAALARKSLVESWVALHEEQLRGIQECRKTISENKEKAMRFSLCGVCRRTGSFFVEYMYIPGCAAIKMVGSWIRTCPWILALWSVASAWVLSLVLVGIMSWVSGGLHVPGWSIATYLKGFAVLSLAVFISSILIIEVIGNRAVNSLGQDGMYRMMYVVLCLAVKFLLIVSIEEIDAKFVHFLDIWLLVDSLATFSLIVGRSLFEGRLISKMEDRNLQMRQKQIERRSKYLSSLGHSDAN